MAQSMGVEGAVAVALEQGDYAQATLAAAVLAPGKEAQLHQYRLQMESYEMARDQGDVHRALRALADARLAAIGAGVAELEEVTSRQLKVTIRLYGGR